MSLFLHFHFIFNFSLKKSINKFIRRVKYFKFDADWIVTVAEKYYFICISSKLNKSIRDIRMGGERWLTRMGYRWGEVVRVELGRGWGIGWRWNEKRMYSLKRNGEVNSDSEEQVAFPTNVMFISLPLSPSTSPFKLGINLALGS